MVLFLSVSYALGVVKTEDIGSHSPAESEGSDEEEKDVDSVNAEKASK